MFNKKILYKNKSSLIGETKMKFSLYHILILGFILIPHKAIAMDSLYREIDSLKDDIKQLQRQVYRGIENSEKKSADAKSDVQIKLVEHDETIRNINGRMDELEYNMKLINDKLDKINRDMEIRFKILEGRQIPDNLISPKPNLPTIHNAPIANNAPKNVSGANITGEDLAPINSPNPQTTPTNEPQALIPDIDVELPQEQTKPLSAKEMYDAGIEALNSGYYDEAELAFKHILDAYPQDKLASNAQFWLGETYYKQKDYNKAKIAFKDGYEKYKNGNKSADSFFKLGLTLKSLNENKKACIILSNFNAEFPKANKDLAKRVKAEAKALGCK